MGIIVLIILGAVTGWAVAIAFSANDDVSVIVGAGSGAAGAFVVPLFAHVLFAAGTPLGSTISLSCLGIGLVGAAIGAFAALRVHERTLV